jgi:acetyl-CoA carboxylase biotin carboxyl carrier protein
VDLKDIKAIIDLMRKNAISEFELERQDFKIKLKRSGNGGTVVGAPEDSPGMVYPSQAASVVVVPPGTGTPATVTASLEIDIKSPMVGTFYRSPSPDSAPYVEIGTEVNADAVVCIIEAMKVMNEIKSEVRGVVTQVLIENGKPVEYGQPLFKVRPL